MKMRLFAIFAGIFMSLAAGSALADIQSDMDEQRDQIQRATRSDQLSRREADALHDNLRHIRHEYDRASRDGRISAHERERLERMLERNDRMIRRMRHNEIRRFN